MREVILRGSLGAINIACKDSSSNHLADIECGMIARNQIERRRNFSSTNGLTWDAMLKTSQVGCSATNRHTGPSRSPAPGSVLLSSPDYPPPSRSKYHL